MDIKVTDLIHRINSFMPKDKCNHLIDLFENNISLCNQERSLKYIEGEVKKFHTDNFKCLNLSLHRNKNKELDEGFEIASHYIQGMIANYIDFLKIKGIREGEPRKGKGKKKLKERILGERVMGREVVWGKKS